MKAKSHTACDSESLTEGSIAGPLIRFAVPLLAVRIVQALYGFVDLAVIGKYCDDIQLSAVGIGANMNHLMNTAMMGVFVGGTISISHSVGAGNREYAASVTGSMSVLYPLCGLIASGSILLFMDPFFALYRTPELCYVPAKQYSTITASFLWLDVGYTYLSAVLRGYGDSKHPMVFISIACATNIALDFLMVGYLSLGVAGAAIATVIAQAFGLLLLAVFTIRNGYPLFAAPSFDAIKKVLRNGLPITVQDTVVDVSFVLIQSLINSYGIYAATAISITNKCTSLALIPSYAFNSALSTVCAQNFGAKKEARAVNTMYVGMLLSVIAALPAFVVCHFFPEIPGKLFSVSAGSMAAFKGYIVRMSYDYLLTCILFTMCGFINASGNSNVAMIICMFTTVLLRAPFAYLFHYLWPNDISMIGWAVPATSAVQAIMYAAYIATGKWKKAKP